MEDSYYNSKLEKNIDMTMSKLSKLLYALVLFGAAALILILFENVIALNIYFVYMFVGAILGLSVILIIQICSKNDDKYDIDEGI
jgi:hypothetical protein